MLNALGDANDLNFQDESNLKELRRIRLLDIKLWSILNETVIFTMFLCVLYCVSYFNLNTSSFTYNQHFLNTFVHQQNSNEIALNNVIFRNA